MGFEYIVCDSPAGIETGALMAMHFADEALVVTNPEVSSVRDSDRILGMLASKTKRAIDGKEPIKEHLLITRYNPNRVQGGQMLSLEDIKEILRIELIGVVPESETVLDASNQGVPAVHLKGTRRVRGLQGRGRPLPRRGPADALHSTPQARLLQAHVRREVSRCPCSPFCWARRRRPPASPRKRLQIILAHERSARAGGRPTTCPRCSASSWR
jgi:hypothetical protein